MRNDRDNSINNLWAKKTQILVEEKNVDSTVDSETNDSNETNDSSENNEQGTPLTIEFDGAKIESFQDKDGNLTGLTKIITKTHGLTEIMAMTFKDGKLVGQFTKDKEFLFNFNEKGELDGKSIVGTNTIIFSRGAVVSIK